jgi:indole-3-glycerol phosphate synthase
VTHVLDGILRAKREEVVALKAALCPATLAGPRPGSVFAALTRAKNGPLGLITEIKRRSPSAGALSTALSVAERALAYGRGGAAMISVLCDAPFFDGGWEHVTLAREALERAGLAVPVLAKEFVVDERQLEEAAGRGADGVLLIARIVSAERLGELVVRSRALGLEPLVEVVTEEELAAALGADAKVIGVNARDLDTLVMDPARTARVLAAIPDDRIAVHLSGLKGPDDVASVARSDVDAALIGEALMRHDDPSALLRSMVLAADG